MGRRRAGLIGAAVLILFLVYDTTGVAAPILTLPIPGPKSQDIMYSRYIRAKRKIHFKFSSSLLYQTTGSRALLK